MSRRNYSKSEDDTIRKMWNDACTDDVIANKLGRTKLSIRSRRVDLKLAKHHDLSKFFARQQQKFRKKTEAYLEGLNLFNIPQLAILQDHVALIEDKLAIDPTFKFDSKIQIKCIIHGCRSLITPIKKRPDWGNLKHFIDPICKECRSAGANTTSFKNCLEKFQCPLCDKVVLAHIGKLSAWRKHWNSFHKDESFESFKNELTKLNLINDGNNYTGFIKTDRTFETIRYDSLSELALLFYIIDNFSSEHFIEKLNKTPKNNRHALKLTDSFYCPDFAIILNGEDIAIAECKGRQLDLAVEKQRALEKYCATKKLGFIWMWAWEYPIHRNSKYFHQALEYHLKSRRNLRVITYGNIETIHDTESGKFIGIADGEEYFERECCVCSQKKFSKRLHTKKNYCGQNGLDCETSDRLEASVSKRICMGCESRPELPLNHFPGGKGHWCLNCKRSKQNRPPKACARCKTVLHTTEYSRLCDKCQNENSRCDNCDHEFAYESHHNRVKKAGSHIFCSRECYAEYKSKHESHESKCVICNRKFTSGSGFAKHCSKCKKKTCCECGNVFEMMPQHVQKIFKKMISKNLPFTAAKRTCHYRCNDCK